MFTSSVYDDLDSTLKSGVNRLKQTTIGNKDHLFNHPISAARADELIALMGLQAGQRVLDIGCGKGEMLVRMVEQHQVSAVGVDTNPFFLADARARAEARIPEGEVQFLERYLADYSDTPDSYDVALCLGHTHAFGGYRHSLQTLMDLIKPGGLVLVGEGFWQQKPDPAYLAVVGGSPSDYNDHRGNVEVGVEEGLIPLFAFTSSLDELDTYQGLYWRAIERYGLANPDDGEAREMVAQVRQWRDAYLRWGREISGFGLYLFTK
jgi:SAM-dependent methyltransferase